MAIRLRNINNIWVALCAVEVDPKPGDVYLDDGQHYALASKFALDWNGSGIGKDLPYDEVLEELMAKEKVRDAKEEIEKWIQENEANNS